jgi:hypothetical protein
MSATITVEHFRKDLLDMFRETFEHSVGIYLYESEALFETLEATSPEEASRRVSPAVANVAAHAEHVAFYLDVLRDLMCGAPQTQRDWDAIWNNAHDVDDAEWQSIRQRVREAHERVMDVLNGIETWEGEHDISGAVAVLCHTAYHLGAIRQLLFLAREQKEVAS